MKRKLFLLDAALAGSLVLAAGLSTGIVSFGGEHDDVFGGAPCGNGNFSTQCAGGTNRSSTNCSRRSCVVSASAGTMKNQQASTESECGNYPDCGSVDITKDCVKSGS